VKVLCGPFLYSSVHHACFANIQAAEVRVASHTMATISASGTASGSILYRLVYPRENGEDLMFAITVKKRTPTFDDFMGVLQDHVTVKSSEDKADILKTFSDLFQMPGVAVDGVKTAMRGGATLRPSVSPSTARVGGAGEPAGLVLSARPGIGSSASGGGGGGGGAAVSASVPKDDGVRGGSGSVLDLGHGGSGVSPLRSGGPPGAGSAVEEKTLRPFEAIHLSGTGAADLPKKNALKRGRGSDTPGHHPISTVEVGTAAVIKEELRHEDVKARKQRKAEADADVEEIDLTVTPPDPPAHVPIESVLGPELLYAHCESCGKVVKLVEEWTLGAYPVNVHRPGDNLYVRNFVLVTQKPCGCEADTPYLFVGGLHCRRSDFEGTCFKCEVTYFTLALKAIVKLDLEEVNKFRAQWSSFSSVNEPFMDKAWIAEKDPSMNLVHQPRSLTHILPCAYLFHLWTQVFFHLTMCNAFNREYVSVMIDLVANTLFGFLQRRDFAIGAMLGTERNAYHFKEIYKRWTKLCEDDTEGDTYETDGSMTEDYVAREFGLMLDIHSFTQASNPVALAKYATVESLREVCGAFRASESDMTVNPVLEYKLGVLLLYTEAALATHKDLTCETVFGSPKKLSRYLLGSIIFVTMTPMISNDVWLMRAQSLTPSNRYVFMCHRLINLYTMGTDEMRIHATWAATPLPKPFPLSTRIEKKALQILKDNKNVGVSDSTSLSYLIGLASEMQRLTPSFNEDGDDSKDNYGDGDANVVQLLKYFKKASRASLGPKSLSAIIVVGNKHEVEVMGDSVSATYALTAGKETDKSIPLYDCEEIVERELVCRACLV
jgi:hypothetical protein